MTVVKSKPVPPRWAVRLKELLEVNKRTATWVASEIGMPGRWRLLHAMAGRKGDYLTAEQQHAIAHLLGVPYDWIFEPERTAAPPQEANDDGAE